MKFLKKLLGDADVTWMPLGEIASIKTGGSVSKQKIADNPGDYPVINSGRKPLGFINEWNTENEPLGVTTRGNVGLITWQEGKYFRGNLNYSISVKKEFNISDRYLYHLLLFLQRDILNVCTFDAIPALNANNLKQILIPIPSIDDGKRSMTIQNKIVRILDTFTELTTELTTELRLRQKQYMYYRDNLLKFNKEGVRPHLLDKLLGDSDVEWLLLGEIASIKTGGSVSKQKIADNPGDYPVINSGREPLGFINEWNTENEPLGVTSRGAGVGSIIWQEGRYFRGNLNYSIKSKDGVSISDRYLYHLLLFMQRDIHNVCTFDGIPALNANNLKRILIPIPCPDSTKESLNIQSKIVNILDKFDMLINSISDGLPREIELRHKQYEYYRDLLFDFPKPKGDVA